jgi:hypothetical protein
MGRDRQYDSNAERQRAYRERQAEEKARLRERLREQLAGGSAKATRRKSVSAKLVKVLGMLGSAHAGERDNAAQLAVRLLKESGLTWYDILDVDREKK